MAQESHDVWAARTYYSIVLCMYACKGRVCLASTADGYLSSIGLKSRANWQRSSSGYRMGEETCRDVESWEDAELLRSR